MYKILTTRVVLESLNMRRIRVDESSSSWDAKRNKNFLHRRDVLLQFKMFFIYLKLTWWEIWRWVNVLPIKVVLGMTSVQLVLHMRGWSHWLLHSNHRTSIGTCPSMSYWKKNNHMYLYVYCLVSSSTDLIGIFAGIFLLSHYYLYHHHTTSQQHRIYKRKKIKVK